jgi:hypothetical protein
VGRVQESPGGILTSAEAREFIAKHDLAEHVAEIVDQAPPLPEHVAQTWREASCRSILKVGAS